MRYYQLVGLALGLAALYALAHALFLGWCWGWWGPQNSPWSWIMDCQCSRPSEHARVQLKYGPAAFVLVPSCIDNSEKNAALAKLMQEGNAGSWWLTENWSLLANNSSNQGEYTLLNVKDGRQVLLQKLESLPQGKFDPQTLEILKNAGNILFPGSGPTIVLPTGFDEAPNIAWFLDGRGGDLREAFNKNRIAYASARYRRYSKNRSFYYEPPMMYLSATQQPIMRLTNDTVGWYSPRGWFKDDLGAILTRSSSGGLTVFPGDPHPVLLAQVPREYLAPEQQRAFDARQHELEQIRAQGNREVWGALGLALLLAGATVGWWLYWGVLRRASRRPH